MTGPGPPSYQNFLITSLTPADFDRLQPHLRRVSVCLRSVLQAPGQPIKAAYFPETGYVSLVATLADGDAAEVGLVGYEGIVGMPLILGTDRSITEAVVQDEGSFLQLEAEIFRRVFAESESFRTLMLRYAMAFNVQVTMTAACNGRHLVDQRLARWLLMAGDRSSGDTFAMTHEFLSVMLGIRRSGVTVAAGLLQKAGLIRYDQGHVWITDRPGLEAAACECHLTAKQEYERLLGVPPPR